MFENIELHQKYLDSFHPFAGHANRNVSQKVFARPYGPKRISVLFKGKD